MKWYFYVLITIAVIAVLIGLVVASKYILPPESKQPKDSESRGIIENLERRSKKDNLPKIFNVGVNLAPYDKTTGMAGDVKFAKINSRYWTYRMFEHYADTMPALDNGVLPGLNVHPEFYLPAGTKIFSISEGTVTDVPLLYSNDYSVLVVQDDAPAWTINYEHVWNPQVKKGDKVKIGQPIAEVSTLQTQSLDPSYGKWALMVFGGTLDGRDVMSYCPYMLFDESVKAEMQAKISRLVTDWEAFIGKDIYDQEKWVAPGCKYEKMTEAQAKTGQVTSE